MFRKKNLKIGCNFIIVTLIIILLPYIILFYIKLQNSHSILTTINSENLHLTDHSFRIELINSRLISYKRAYNRSLVICKNTPLNEEQKKNFPLIPKLLNELRQQILPYPRNHFTGRGIVMTVGLRQLKYARVNLKMIEHSGTRLPVQVWFSSNDISTKTMINLIKESSKLNVSVCCFHTSQCSTLTETWKLNTNYVYKPRTDNLYKQFPYKPAAIISATFVEVLFLDCDAYVTRDPIDLFTSDPMYLEFGALFFPDAYQSRQHPQVWQLFNTSCGEHEYELDSAMIMVNKKRVWNGLYMTKLMNDHHELFYKFVTDGDKDTFRLGFRYMDEKYYIAMIPCATGSFNGDKFCGWTLCKTDSLGQHIYVNHVHIFKYENIPYTVDNLRYTRIGLGDPNENSFFFKQCRLADAATSCFHIVNKPNSKIIDDQCYAGGISLNEMDDHIYSANESLLFKESRNNQIFIGKTDHFMPGFVSNLLKYF